MRSKPPYWLLFLLTLLHGSGTTRISSLIFFDLAYDTPRGSSFNVTRTYLDIRSRTADDVTLRITSDVGRTREDDPLVLFLKHAYLSWNTSLGVLEAGVQPTNYFGPTKKTWGYRFVEKFPTDRVGFGATADLGVSLRKEVFPRLNVHAAVYNGPGYKNQENDSYKRVSVLLSYGEQELNRRPGWNTGGAVSYEPYEVPASTDRQTKITALLFGGYASTNFRIGGEYTILADTGHDDRSLLGTTMSVRLRKALSLWMRGEVYDPSTIAENDGELYLLAGLNFMPRPGLSVAPNLRYASGGTSSDGSDWMVKLNLEFRI
ncbi:MAG: hypothetical protein ACE5GH_02450 [Fidelibacterota bacterium]